MSESTSRSRGLDAIWIAIAVLANPLTYVIDETYRAYPPDSIAYATMARRIFLSAELFLSGWSHIDSGLILPPVLPFLTALAGLTTPNFLNAAEYISAAAILLTTVPLYLLARQLVGRPEAAACTVFALSFQSVLEIGLSPLTEALFVLMSSSALAATALGISKKLSTRLSPPASVGSSFIGITGSQ